MSNRDNYYNTNNNNQRSQANKTENYSYAPFNFIPLSKRIIARYNKMEELPAHDEYAEGCLSGEITYDIKNITDIIVSDGKGKFFKNTDGLHCIPGSTIRGKLRSNVGILGFSSIADDIQDEKFLYRRFASKSSSLNKEYKDRLGMKQESINGKTFSILQNVKAGYIKKCGEDKYVIVKNKEIKGRTYFRISDKDLKEKYKGIRGINLLERRDYETYVRAISYNINSQNNSVSDINEVGKLSNSGYLLGSGKMHNKKSHYIINEIGTEEIILSNEDIRAYKKYYIKDKKSKLNINGFYSLPEKNGDIKAGFYVEYKDRVYFGFTPYLRLFYDNSICDGIPVEHKVDVLDYNKALFGFVSKEGGYKTRVAVEDAIIEGKPKINTHTMVLGEPKATCVQLYLNQDGDANSLTSYNGNFEIRGMKYYWLKEEVKPIEAKGNVNSKEEAIDKGNVFKGKIRFTNLQEDELGLLLWAIYIHKDANQSIGKGKPYGFGNIKINNLAVSINNINNKYKDIFSKESLEISVEDYINKYKEYAKSKITGLANIEDDLAVKTFIEVHKNTTRNEKVEYMSIERFINNRKFNEFGTYIPLSSPFKIMGLQENKKQVTGNNNRFKNSNHTNKNNNNSNNKNNSTHNRSQKPKTAYSDDSKFGNDAFSALAGFFNK